MNRLLNERPGRHARRLQQYRLFIGHLLVAVLLFASPVAARQRAIVVGGDIPPPLDKFSAAETSAVRTTHLELDLEVDFEARRLRGSAIHTIERFQNTTRFIVDTRNLEIHDVFIDGKAATWSLGDSTDAGRPLVIDIEASTRTVRIDYETTVTSRGLNWLSPIQTTNDTSPMVYTFGQPDHTREWIPIQDTPGVRMRYDATIRVPPGLIALMSAVNPTEPSPDGVHHLHMPYPIAPYLIALAIGRFEFRALDERTGFYAEPAMVEDALNDLQYIPGMLPIAESILGPYPYDRYDVLLLPPGYGAGGMENPMLNFINVSGVVPGDGESPPVPTTVIAHELAHSWVGDLVTCGTWSDTWLNEGFATYYSARILGAMQGPEREEISFYWDRQNYEGYVRATLSQPRFQILHREFLPGDRLSIFSTTNYSKGSLFLQTLEDRLGRATFDPMLQSYVRRYALRWVDDRAFLDHVSSFTTDASLLLDDWVYTPGMPANVTAPTRASLWERIGVEAARFRSGTPASAINTTGWTSFELGLFLWQINDVIPTRMSELDAAFSLSSRKSPPLQWLVAVAATFYAPGMPMLERFLTIGSWGVITIYQKLIETPAGKTWARKFFTTVGAQYEDGIRFYVGNLLGYTGSSIMLVDPEDAWMLKPLPAGPGNPLTGRREGAKNSVDVVE